MPYKTKGNRLVNEVTLGDGYPLSSNLKPLKVGGKTSPLEMATAYPDDSNSAKVKVVGDLEVTGKITGNDESGDITSVGVTSLNDASSDTTNSGSVNFVTQGSTGITTSITAGPTINITGTAATSFVKGVVELATTAETTTGTDAARAVTPDGLKDGYQGSANVVTTGALNSGSITNGFDSIDVGDNKIATTGTLEAGRLDVEAATLTTSTAGTDTVIDISQTLNAGSGENSGPAVEKYAMIRGAVTETDAAGWESKYFMQMVGGSGGDTDKFTTDISGNVVSAGTITSSNGVCGGGRFQVQGQYEVYGRYGLVNTWYTGNQSYGTSIAVGDWASGGQKYNYAQFTASAQVKLQSWTFNGSFSTTKDYELEMWHVEAPSNGSSTPDAATKVGSTQSITASAARLYVIKDDDLDYTIPIGDQLYLLTRYTDGSGTVYQYGTVGMEFSYD